MPLNKLRFFQNLLALSAVTLIITVWATVIYMTYRNSLLIKYSVDTQIQKKTTPPKENISVSPTPATSVPGWGTYSDELNIYQINAPSSWERLTHSSNFWGMHLITLKAPDDSVFQASATLAKNQTLTSYLQSIDKRNSTAWEGLPSKNILTSNSVTIGAIPGIERKEEWLAADYTTVVTYFKVSDYVFDFSIQPSNVKYPGSEVYKNYYRILSSFQSINNTETTPTPTLSFTCPPGGWIDCMPGPNKGCSQDVSEKAIEWYEINCPNYQGIAY
jgi:hypothetical protein